MSNCILTSLKSSVNNENLPLLGKVVVVATKRSVDNSYFFAMGRLTDGILNEGETIRFVAKCLDANTELYDSISGYSGSTIDSGSRGTSFRINGNFDSKFEVDVVKSSYVKGVIDLNKMPYSETLLAIQVSDSLFVDSSEAKSKGSINDFKKKYPNLRYAYIQSSGVSGDITSAFGEYTDMRKILLANSPNITGSIEGMATAMISAGKNSGTIVFQSNSKVTYQGVVLGDGTAKDIVFSNGSYSVNNHT